MSLPAEVHQEQLPRIKRNIEKSYDYFKPNCDRFNRFRRFVFETSIDPQTRAVLKTQKKPQIEFNICEAYLSRLRGEFSKQEPSIEVMAGDEKPVDPKVIEIVEGHFKHILEEANKNGFEYQIYTDTLSGGFSVGKVWTEYAHEMSMNQVVRVGRVYDPILCGFDPLARDPHKGDGEFCFELFPKTKEEFKKEYPDINIDKIKFARELEGFSWAYRNVKDDILLIADYYEKKKRKVKICETADGKVMLVKDYNKMIREWDGLEQPPIMKGKPRMTTLTTIVRYRIIDNLVLEYVETDFTMLPLIFFDGNSVLIREETAGSVTQMTRPYIYNAKGIQLLKNFAGQSLANELENMIQHKWMVSKEALPNEEEYLEAYRDVQQADVLVYNAFDPMRQDTMLPPPTVVNRVQIPPELSNTFSGADQMTQVILGNFDMDIGKLNQSQVSGIAVQESVTQSNSAAMPYIVGFLQGLTRMATVCVDIFPKYIITPRTIPIVGIDGKKSYVKVNHKTPDSIDLKYEENALNVQIEAGVNFSVQKSRNFQTIIALQQASPLFAQFMATDGLMFLLKNVEMEGIDELQQAAEQWMQQQKQIQQQQQQAQMEMAQNNPQMLKAKTDAQKSQMDFMIKAEDLKLKAEDAKLRHDATLVKAHAEIIKAHAEVEKVAMSKRDQQHRHAHESHDMRHRHLKEAIETSHEIEQAKKESKHASKEKK